MKPQLWNDGVDDECEEEAQGGEGLHDRVDDEPDGARAPVLLLGHLLQTLLGIDHRAGSSGGY